MSGVPKATLRLAAVVALTVTLLSLGGMALQYRIVADRLEQQTLGLLKADLDGLASLYEQRRIIALRQAIDYRAAAASPGEMLVLLARDGTVLAGTHDTWPEAVEPQGAGFAPEGALRFAAHGQNWLGVGRILPGGFPLLVARGLGSVEGTLLSLRRAIVALGLGMLAAAALVGWIMARQMLARIARVNALADRVAGGDLAARLPGPRSDDEFGQMESHVHAMLDRIEALNRATHRLSDTIAHELRTPLNRMLQKLAQVHGHEAVTDALRADMRAAIRVFDALLDISRAEADQGQGGGLLPLDLAAALAEVWELYAPLAEDRGLTLHLDLRPGLQVLGDRTLIGQMLANLMDNAVKYCRPGDQVSLTLTEDADHHILRLADTGPGLPDDLRAEAFERFTRAPRDLGTPGHGLGLALVRAIAARHGAKLALPATGKGFVIEMLWPKLGANS